MYGRITKLFTSPLKGKPVQTITAADTSNQQKENPNNVNSNKATYASVAA
jgi:hypothetical protein